MSICLAAGHGHKTYNDPAKAGDDFALQGEYAGTVSTDKGDVKYAAQIIARGSGKFHAVGFRGGLPGAGWDKSDKIETDGKSVDGAVAFDIPNEPVQAILKNGSLTVVDSKGNKLGVLKKVHRKSPTMGAKPPKGAIVLFDGTTADNFQHGRIVDGGLLAQGVTSKKKFGDHRLHLEFRSPFMPTAIRSASATSGSSPRNNKE